MFNENSIIVQSWVNQIRAGHKVVEQIPKIGNLKEVVVALLEQGEEETVKTDKK